MKEKHPIINLLVSRFSMIGVIALLSMSILIPYIFGYGGGKLWVDASFAIGIAIFSTLSISKFLQEETAKFLFREFPMQQKINDIGIKDFPTNNSIKDMKDISTSKTLTVVMNDGKNFISNNFDVLRNRFKIDGLITIFIFLDYKHKVVKNLCAANGKPNKKTYKEKIIKIKNYYD